jgi:uncharacterized protein YceK
MRRILTLLLAANLSGCATYTNPVTGQQETYLTQEGDDLTFSELSDDSGSSLLPAVTSADGGSR